MLFFIRRDFVVDLSYLLLSLLSGTDVKLSKDAFSEKDWYWFCGI